MYDGKVVDTSIAVLIMYVQYDITDMYIRYCKYNVLFVKCTKRQFKYDMYVKILCYGYECYDKHIMTLRYDYERYDYEQYDKYTMIMML